MILRKTDGKSAVVDHHDFFFKVDIELRFGRTSRTMLNPLRMLHLTTAPIIEKSYSGAEKGKSTAVTAIAELNAGLTQFA